MLVPGMLNAGKPEMAMSPHRQRTYSRVITAIRLVQLVSSNKRLCSTDLETIVVHRAVKVCLTAVTQHLVALLPFVNRSFRPACNGATTVQGRIVTARLQGKVRVK